MNKKALMRKIWNQIEESPEDALSKMQYADLLEEEEQSSPALLRGLRYCIKHKKRPYKWDLANRDYYGWNTSGKYTYDVLDEVLISIIKAIDTRTDSYKTLDEAFIGLGNALLEMERILAGIERGD